VADLDSCSSQLIQWGGTCNKAGLAHEEIYWSTHLLNWLVNVVKRIEPVILAHYADHNPYDKATFHNGAATPYPSA
jgi:hypothetical protein